MQKKWQSLLQALRWPENGASRWHYEEDESPAVREAASFASGRLVLKMNPRYKSYQHYCHKFYRVRYKRAWEEFLKTEREGIQEIEKRKELENRLEIIKKGPYVKFLQDLKTHGALK
jgi:hypothetical protein